MSSAVRIKTYKAKSLLNRFFRNEGGLAAIEFAILAPVFFLLIFAILQTAIIFLAGSALDYGMQETARFVQTGQAANTGLSKSGFVKRVCDAAVMMPDCENTLKVDVRKFDNFIEATFPSLTKENGDIIDDEDFQFDPGEAESTIVIRVLFEWPVIGSFFGLDLSNGSGNGKRRLISSWAFQNEPF